MNAVAYALQLLQTIGPLIQAGRDVMGLINQAKASLATMQAEGRDPTPAEWDALNASIKALRDELHAP
jgi:hypothetical protein